MLSNNEQFMNKKSLIQKNGDEPVPEIDILFSENQLVSKNETLLSDRKKNHQLFNDVAENN